MKWTIQSFINDTLDGLTYAIVGPRGIIAEGLTREQADNLLEAHLEDSEGCDCDPYVYECTCDCGECD